MVNPVVRVRSFYFCSLLAIDFIPFLNEQTFSFHKVEERKLFSHDPIFLTWGQGPDWHDSLIVASHISIVFV